MAEHVPILPPEDEARDRVERGAALLDKTAPGWRERVDPETLDMTLCTRCVLGQLFGHYMVGFDRLEVAESSVVYGFDLPWPTKFEDSGYDLLQDAWLEMLRAKP
jgi:hypothetical protein